MPEVSQYVFSHAEVLELLIKKADLHEGKWQLIINFTFAAANAGPTPADIIPSAFVRRGELRAYEMPGINLPQH